ncbi:hypothetical protein B0H67DRAFT_671416 [Lasiosphaeris hirsuta]|uniref:Uncharacterized protein n=1 Tax=Lasiosphaeris hirsuta TaxID=260670 RepID=A0AA40A275_9PEZI|nr:hypothetical protein B0H67DRAFT_671416 [Lasiosphaeris hirsuta]
MDSVFWAISWDINGKSIARDGKEGNLIGMVKEHPRPGEYSGSWNSFSARKVQSLIADYDLFRDWIKICETCHSRACQARKPRVPGFRLIDRRTRTIIQAHHRTRHKYTALSYR